MDLRNAGSIRANTASMTEMVSAAVFPASLAASVTRDLRSWRTSTGRVRLQMMRSPSQWPPSVLPSTVLGRSWMETRFLDGILRRSRSAWPAAFVTTREITPQLLGPLGCPIDEGVDRLATHGPQTTFVSSLQPAGNLLRGPPLGEAVDNEGS